MAPLFCTLRLPLSRRFFEHSMSCTTSDTLSFHRFQAYIVTWGLLNVVPTWAQLYLQATVRTFGLGHSLIFRSARPLGLFFVFRAALSVVMRSGNISLIRFMIEVIAGSLSVRITNVFCHMALVICFTPTVARSVAAFPGIGMTWLGFLSSVDHSFRTLARSRPNALV